jgi:apolipoprotein D and lipocalin family protein
MSCFERPINAPQSWSGAILRCSACAMIVFLSACGSVKPLATVEYVDLDRFMGDWYVIANIPTSIEEEAFNAVESYQLDKDGSIATTFTFNEGSFRGEKKQYNPRGFIRDSTTNAEWGMQFIWPIKADYRIIYLDEDYQLTVIGRNKRDYVWVMARSFSIQADQYDAMVQLVADAGYDITKIRKVPQQW